MKPELGGIRIPSVPPAASAPVASEGEYLRRIISGRETEPMVTAVDRESPHTAAKPVQPATPAMPMPPGIWPIHLLAELNRSTEIPE